MNQFKPGDKVTPISVDHEGYQDDMKPLLGKTLTVIAVYPGADCPTICAGEPGSIDRFWFADDLRLVSTEEPTDKLRTVNWGGHGFLKPYADTSPTEPTDPAPAETAIKRFKVGDYVVPLRADRPGCTHEMKVRIGKALQVYDTTGSIGDLTVFAGKPESESKRWFWNPDDLRPATVEEIAAIRELARNAKKKAKKAHEPTAPTRQITIMRVPATKGVESDTFVIRRHADTCATEPTDSAPAAAQKPDAINRELYARQQSQKPLRRGDLVMHRGQIGVVHDTDQDGENGYWVAALTGDGSCVWRCAEELTRIGSIRKKIKRIKKEMEGAK